MSILRRTRVLTVTDSLEVGGAERVAVDISNSLDRRRHEVLFCATRADGPLREVLEPDVSTMVLGRRATWDVAGLARFASAVRSNEIDIIHTHGRGTMKFVALARRTGLLHTAHLFHDHYGRLHLDRRASAGLRGALRTGTDAYLGVDSRLCSWAIDTVGLHPQQVHLARSGVDLRRFTDVDPIDLRREFDLRGVEMVLVMVANFRQQKDHPTVLRALADLAPEVRERLAVIIVGSTTSEPEFHARCMQMVDDLGIEDQIRVAGARADTVRLLAGADGTLLASKNETGPLVVLEYMASAKPFVATDTGEITWAVRGLDIGFTPAPRDRSEMARALEQLLALGPDGRAQMGRRGRQVAEQVFDQQLVTRGIERIYQQVLAGPVGPGSGAFPDRGGQITPIDTDGQYSQAGTASARG